MEKKQKKHPSWIKQSDDKSGKLIYSDHFLRLFPLVCIHNAGFTVSVYVADQRGDLAHLLLLEDVGLRAGPGHNRLGTIINIRSAQRGKSGTLFYLQVAVKKRNKLVIV